MNFKFRALKDGETITGEREANDRFALAREMRRENLTLLSATPVSAEVARSGRWLAGWRFWRRVGLKEKIVFVGSLGSMIGAGLSLARALAVIEKQTGNKYFQELIGQVSRAVVAGKSLSQSLALFPEVFPAVMISMVAAGEESGKLPESLETVRHQLAKNYDLRRRIRGVMIYPLIILLAIVVLTVIMMIFLIPNLTSLFNELEVELPLSTRIMIAVSGFMSRHVFGLAVGVLLAAAAFFRLLKTAWGRRWNAAVLLRLPIIKVLTRNFNSAVTMRTLSSLIASGVSLVESLQITAVVTQNPFYQDVLTRAKSQVEKGVGLSAIFAGAGELYPPLVREMAEVGEETGNLSGMLGKGAVMLENEVDQTTKNLAVVIEPLLTIIIGLAVGFFAISMIGPIYSLTDKL